METGRKSNITTIYAVIGESPGDGIWYTSNFPLIASDAHKSDGSLCWSESIAMRLNFIKAWADIISIDSKKTYKIRKFVLSEES